MTPEKITAERNGARQLYLWSLLLPLLAIPLACLGPVLFLLPLLYLYLLVSGLFSRLAFVSWHSRQWLLWSLVTGAIAVCGVLPFIMSDVRGGTWLVTGLGGLVMSGGWWLGNLFGLWQANRGDCLLWSLWSTSAPLPRPWKAAPAAAPLPGPIHADILLRGQRLSHHTYGRLEAIECFMQVFRAGPPALRQQAITELEKLGEVEVF